MDPLTQRLFHMGAAQSPTGYWISEIAGMQSGAPSFVTVAASGNVYGCSTTSNSRQYIYKLNENGLLLWQRLYHGPSQNNVGGISINSSEDVFVCGNNYGSIDGNRFASTIVKYNTSGVFQYQRSFDAALVSDSASGIICDSTGSFVVAGSTNDGRGYIAAFDSTGSISWKREILSSSISRLSGIAGGDLYVCGSANPSLLDAMIAKLSSTGLTTWIKKYDTTEKGSTLKDIVVGTGTNPPIFAVGDTSSLASGIPDALIVCYNNDGSTAWERALGGSSSVNYGIAVAVAINNKPTIVGTSGEKIMIAQYDNLGNLLWQRFLGSSEGQVFPLDISILGSGAIHVTGQLAGTDKLITCKLRPDGTGTGAFGSYTYEAGNATDRTISLGGGSLTLTNQVSSIAAGTPTLTSETATLSQTGPIIA